MSHIKKMSKKTNRPTRRAGGKGNEALVGYHDLPEHLKALCIEKLGDFRKMKIQNT